MPGQNINKPTPINQEVVWDKTKTIISTTDKFGNITDVNQTFVDVCGYTANELIFKITWDNILAGRNFHAIIKNLSKSGKYYWVITDFEVGRNIMNEVVSITARRRAIPDYVVTDHIEPLYQTLLKLEKIGDMPLSNRYFKGFLEKQGKSYIEYVMSILEGTSAANPSDMQFDPIGGTNTTDEISDDIFSEEHPSENTNITQRKSFFAKLFSTN